MLCDLKSNIREDISYSYYLKIINDINKKRENLISRLLD